MRLLQDVIHVAIPARDLAATERFYSALLGCQVARRYSDRITFNFFGCQVVCHLSPGEPVNEPRLYPRHFGVTFERREDFDSLLRLIETRNVPVFQPVARRFVGLVEEHSTIVVRDPTDNLIEFKHYLDWRMMY